MENIFADDFLYSGAFGHMKIKIPIPLMAYPDRIKQSNHTANT